MKSNLFTGKRRRASRALVASVLVASTVAVAPIGLSAQDAGAGFDEATSGDISNDQANPLALALGNGSNVLSGSVVGGGASADIDYVTVNVPAGHELSALNLVSYESGNSQSFIGIQAGNTFTVSPQEAQGAIDQLLGFTLFGDSTPGDLLPAIGAAQGVQGFAGALGAGDYTFWIQETGADAANYSLDFVVSPVAPAEGVAVVEDAPAADDSGAAFTTNVDLEFAGLEPLGDGFVYEGWVIIDGAPVSTGRFDVEADGSLTLLSSSLADDLSAATTVVITIEPEVDPDPGPADPKPLAGDIVDGVAELSIGHPAALGDDFSSSGGQFLVATPTTETTDDEYSGVWFLEVTPDGPVAGLDIPELPAGWVYEGWVVINGQPVSTGRFLDPAGPDDFGGFSGPLGNPPFPGEDFIVNAPDGLEFPLDLRGVGTVVLTIEPADDDSPAPFAMRPLAAAIPADLEFHGSVELGAGPGVPSGVATLDIPAGDDAGDGAPAAVEFVNTNFGPRYLEVQPNVNVYSSNQSNTATEFILHPRGEGVYLIQSVSTGLYLHGHGEGGNFNVDVVGPVDDTAYWELVEVEGGYHVVNVGLGRALQADRPGFNVDTEGPDGDLGARVTWAIVPAN